MIKAATRILAQLVTLIFLASCTSNTAPQTAQTTPTARVTSTRTRTATPTFIVSTPFPTESAANIARRQQRTLEKDAHQKTWDDAKINHYQFTLTFDRCGDNIPNRFYIIEVKDSVSTILNLPSKLSENERSCVQRYASVDSIYQLIDHLIQTDTYMINIRYDATYAYPASIDIKYYPPPVELDGYSAYIKDFKVLP